jgi:hypothetical protein
VLHFVLPSDGVSVLFTAMLLFVLFAWVGLGSCQDGSSGHALEVATLLFCIFSSFIRIAPMFIFRLLGKCVLSRLLGFHLSLAGHFDLLID